MQHHLGTAGAIALSADRDSRECARKRCTARVNHTAASAVQWFEKLAEAAGPDLAQVVDTKRNVALGVAQSDGATGIEGAHADS